MSSKRVSSAGPSKPKVVWLPSLDLHWKTLEEAELAVIEKLRPLSNLPYDTIFEVITGLGNHSKGEPVLLVKIPELLKMFHVNIKVTPKGGGFTITIPAQTELYLSFDERHQVDFAHVCHSQLKLKGASSSYAQASVSHSGMDDVVGMINDYAQELRCREDQKEIITMPNENYIFEEKNETYCVLRKEVLDFCQREPVAAALISIYMRILYAENEKSCNIIKFVDPASISTTLQKISKGLKGKGKKNSPLCFIPYYIQSQFRWVFMVIDYSSMITYWIDFLHKKPDKSTKSIVENWLDTPLTWKYIKVPKQTDCGQSGYWVMICIRELVCETDTRQAFEKKTKSLNDEQVYKPEEIDKVRGEVIHEITTK